MRLTDNDFMAGSSLCLTPLPSMLAIDKDHGDVFNLSCDLTWPQNLSAMWLSCKEPVNVRKYPAMFGGHKHCGSGDIMASVCNTILQDHVTKRSSNIMS